MTAYQNIPPALKKEKRWVGWSYKTRKGKRTKVPIDPRSGEGAKSNDDSTWTSYEDAMRAAKVYRLDGIGIMLGNGLFGVDLDHVIDPESGEVEPMAKWIVEKLGSYAEISPSGEGIHVLCYGSLPEGRRRKGKVEMYDGGRYFTVTGKRYGEWAEVVDCTQRIKPIHQRVFGEVKVEAVKSVSGGVGRTPMEDDKLLNRIRRSESGARFDQLYGGSWEGRYDSQSEADLALCNILAFWTRKDAVAMDRIFRTSGLMRKKWDRSVGGGRKYGQATIQLAINSTRQTYGQGHGKVRPAKSDGKSVTPKAEPLRYTLDDEGNAKRLYDRHGRDMHYSYVHKHWYVWSGKLWREDLTGQVRQMARGVLDEMEAGIELRPDDKTYIHHVRRTRGKMGVDHMLTQMQSMEGIPILPHQMDCDAWRINCKNGTIDLRSGELDEHRRSDTITKVMPVNYDEDAKCPRWEEFLLEIMDGREDMVQYLQSAVGYSLTGSIQEQCIFVLYGSGANGKSTFMDIVATMMGGYCMNAQPDSIMVKRQAGAATADIARLRGSRLVTTVEPDEKCRLHEGIVKQLTGGDKVTCRFLYGKEFEYVPTYKIWLATNHKPSIRGTDDGIWRRMRLVPFTVKIPPKRQDKNLLSKLKGELSGILSWAVRGCLGWQSDGLVSPLPVQRGTSEYRKEMDQVQGFLEDCTVPMAGRFMATADIYSVYKLWAKINGEYQISQRMLSMKLQEKGLERSRTMNRKGFKGLYLSQLGSSLHEGERIGYQGYYQG